MLSSPTGTLHNTISGLLPVAQSKQLCYNVNDERKRKWQAIFYCPTHISAYTYTATLFEFLVFEEVFAHFSGFGRHMLIFRRVPLARMFLVRVALALLWT